MVDNGVYQDRHLCLFLLFGANVYSSVSFTKGHAPSRNALECTPSPFAPEIRKLGSNGPLVCDLISIKKRNKVENLSIVTKGRCCFVLLFWGVFFFFGLSSKTKQKRKRLSSLWTFRKEPLFWVSSLEKHVSSECVLCIDPQTADTLFQKGLLEYSGCVLLFFARVWSA